MKFPWTLVVLMLVSYAAIANNVTTHTMSAAPAAYSEEEVKDRLAQLNLPLEVVSNPQVLTRIRQYVTAGKNDTELILGRTIVYFPMFEHYLQQYNLPEELKYLPMIESGLRPTVKSGVGAAGMWQLMPITARYNGLIVNAQIDQRFDAYASTEAAVKMLAYLHDQLGDWGLVLAAYNSGLGRVKKAVRAAGSRDYWEVKAFLPKETQKYVPAFIAAAYIAQNYTAHNLNPRLTPTTTLAKDTRVIKVKQAVNFNQITNATGLSSATIRKLNPAYVQAYVPASKAGYNVVLPTSAMTSFKNYLSSKQKVLTNSNAKLVPTVYTVVKGDSLEKVARMFNTTKAEIMQWNGLSEEKVMINQELTLYLSRTYLMSRA